MCCVIYWHADLVSIAFLRYTDDIPVDPSQTNNLPVIVTVGTIITVLLLSLIGICAAFFLQYQFRWRRTTVKISSKTEPSDLSQFRNPTYFGK